MSSLYVIRHGEASFGAADYDVLTPRGEEQAARLGRALARAPLRLDAVFTGPARRHRDTCRIALDAARAGGAELPEPELLDDLDEFPGLELFRRALPNLEELDEELAALVKAGMPSDPRELARVAARSTRRFAALWARGALDDHGLERFDDFDARVRRALDHIMKTCGRGAQVASITSAGPVAIAVRRALGLSVDQTIAIMSATANASVTELRYRDDALGLFRFNVPTDFP